MVPVFCVKLGHLIFLILIQGFDPSDFKEPKRLCVKIIAVVVL
jgi:hypothetical protein